MEGLILVKSVDGNIAVPVKNILVVKQYKCPQEEIDNEFKVGKSVEIILNNGECVEIYDKQEPSIEGDPNSSKSWKQIAIYTNIMHNIGKTMIDQIIFNYKRKDSSIY